MTVYLSTEFKGKIKLLRDQEANIKMLIILNFMNVTDFTFHPYMSATHTQILICSSLHRLKFYGIDLAKMCVLLYKLILLAIQKYRAYLKFCCWIHSKCFSFTLSSSFKTLTCVVVKWPSIKWSCETFFLF